MVSGKERSKSTSIGSLIILFILSLSMRSGEGHTSSRDKA
jgi:hypothetical protein